MISVTTYLYVILRKTVCFPVCKETLCLWEFAFHANYYTYSSFCLIHWQSLGNTASAFFNAFECYCSSHLFLGFLNVPRHLVHTFYLIRFSSLRHSIHMSFKLFHNCLLLLRSSVFSSDHMFNSDPRFHILLHF